MKNVSKSMFSGAFSLAGKVAKTGKKVSESLRPELVALSTMNKFALNGKARKLMDIQAALDSGQDVRVVILDAVGQEGVDTVEERFFLGVGYTKNSQAVGAKLNKAGEFSYSGIYGTIMAEDVDIEDIPMEDLVRKGVVVKTVTEGGKNSYISTKKIHMEVAELIDENDDVIDEVPVDEDKDGDPISTKVYALKNFEVIAHNPQGDDEPVDEDDE